MQDNTENFKIDFVGIGAAKCATTWAYRCLIEHPEICGLGPYKKELNFFLHKKIPFVENDNCFLYNRGINFYKKYFSHCPKNSIKGEFCAYSIFDPVAARLIRYHFPDVKIIACLRNPVERAYSLYWYAKVFLLKEKNNTFEEALSNNPEPYIDDGMYYKQLKVYYDLFPKENIGVFFMEDLKKDPVKFMQSIYAFLKVDQKFVAPSTAIKENPAKKAKIKLFKKILDNSIPAISIFLWKTRFYFLVVFLRKLGVEDLILYINHKVNAQPFEKPEINKDTAEKLKKIFREDIENLERLLNKDLSVWK